VYGGTSLEPQKAALWKGVDIVIGTPGRIMDLQSSNTLRQNAVEFAILDEADRMLDMGFKDDVEKILDAVPGMSQAPNAPQLPEGQMKPQTVLFSATVPEWVMSVAKKYMKKPVTIDLVEGAVAASLDVQHLVIACPWQVRGQTVADLIRVYGGADGRTIVFVDTKKEADELAVHPAITSKVEVKAMHGDVPQSMREGTLQAFKKGNLRCIVATDVAARGLDIKGVDLVIQTQPPAGKFSGRADVDTYVHRSGRTGRAGAKGICITLFTRQQEGIIQDIERATKNVFSRIGAPQPADLVRVSGVEALDRLSKVSADCVDIFLPVAEEALRKAASGQDITGKRKAAGSDVESDSAEELPADEKIQDPTTVLARALAVIAGYVNAPEPRSLLSGSEGQQTFMFTAPPGQTIQSGSYVWNGLKAEIDPSITDDFRGMTLLADGSGAVFDVPAKHVHTVRKASLKPKSRISTPEVLPELIQRAPEPPAPRWGNGGGYGGGRGGGFGGRGGGRGGGFGGGRGGGRGGFRR
jgi:ATP-dependent RNA helicase DDX21